MTDTQQWLGLLATVAHPTSVTGDSLSQADHPSSRLYMRPSVAPQVMLRHCLLKAYDTVWRDGLWLKLWDMGVKGKMWRVVKGMYEVSRSAVLLDGEKSV